MTTLNAASSWNVGKVSGVCTGCGAVLPPNAVCWAALCDQPMAPKQEANSGEQASAKKEQEGKPEPMPFARVDFCETCWGMGRRPEAPLEMFGFWKTTVPVPQEKKKLLVDDSVLVDVFGRIEGRTEPQEVRFRFVLALILMRKRLLKYEGMEESSTADTQSPEVWRMTPKGSEAVVRVVNPHLAAEQITEVSQQLSAILAEEV